MNNELRDAEERRAHNLTKAQLIESEERYRRLFEAARDGIFLLDFKTGKITDSNPFMTELLGYSKDAFIGKYLWEVGFFKDEPAAKESFLQLQTNGYIRYKDLPLEKKDGGKAAVEFVSNVYQSGGKKVIQCNIRDISARKKGEDALLASEERFRRISEITSDIAYSCSAGEDSRFSSDWVTGATDGITGYTNEEIKAHGCWRFLVVEEDLPLFDTNVTNLAPGSKDACELRIRHKNGGIIWLYSVTECIPDLQAPGRRILYGRLSDITERRQAEAELLRLSSFPRLNPNPILEISNDGSLTYQNTAMERAVANLGAGYSALSFIPGNFKELLSNFQAGRTDVLTRELAVGDRVFLESIHYVVPDGLTRVYILDITERKKAEETLQHIEWMLTRHPADSAAANGHVPPGQTYGGLTALNTSCVILDAVGPQMLKDIASDYLDLLGTSSAVYERNGDYAFGIFASGWCQLLDLASRQKCGTQDNRAALRGGKWLCHESCWTSASRAAMETGQPADIECAGGIRLYAVPIRAGAEIIGSINFGYGTPPADPARLQELADRFGVTREELQQQADAYENRPPFIIELAKNRLSASARLIGEIVARRQAETNIREAYEMERIFNTLHHQSLTPLPLQKKLYEHLATLLSIPWLAVEPKGAVFLATGRTLTLTAQQGLAPALLVSCANIPVGKCLCGRAAESGKVVASTGAGLEHDIACDGIHPEGHYCAPIIAAEATLGVLALFLKEGTEFSAKQRDFIQSVSDIIASDIIHARVEGQFAHSQKMEAVGLLAGGVAHDFNNILTAVIAYAEFIRRDLPPGDPKLADAQEILTAADRAAALTRQLLAFGRRQIMAPQLVDLNKIVGSMTNMLRRLIGENIKLTPKLASAPCLAMVDPGQIEQVIMNLAINARDAMPDGGTITLETEILPPDKVAHPDMPHGPLVCLSVRDAGCGMTAEVKNRIFEPFFTTKEQGKGTGLGLSTVFGIIKQSGGEIAVESEPDKGATFLVYLPFAEPTTQDKDKDKDKDKDALIAKGRETILFVEDDDGLRRLGTRILAAGGYTVLTAANGIEALKTLELHGKPVDLLMTDVVMPGMNGRELGIELTRRKLAGRVIYMSGYTDDAIIKHGVLEPGIAFIYKPFTVKAILLKLREVLDGPANQAKA